MKVPLKQIIFVAFFSFLILPVKNAADEGAVSKNAVAVKTGRHFYFQELAADWVAAPHLTEANINTTSTKKKKSSVLLIVIDALNAKHIGAYGYERNTTPNIDSIAKEGVLFTDWVSNSSWTRPSFTTILTGVPKSVHGMELTDKNLPAKMKTLAKIYKKNGFRTGAFVGNPLIQKKWGYNNGFDVFKDAATLGDFPTAEKIVDETIRWIGQRSDKPYLAVLFLTDTHTPYASPKEARHFSADFKNIVTEPPREVVTPLSSNTLDGIIAAYDDELRYADAQIGRLITWLTSNGLYNETAMVITADHGEIFGEHNCFQHAYHMWEPVLRVPFIVKAPNLAETGQINMPAGHLDTMPTVLHLGGISYKTRWGKSVFALENSKGRDEKIVVSAYDARGVRRQAARLGALKLIRYEKVGRMAFGGRGKESRDYRENPSLQIPGPRYELYNLETDPNETKNIFRTQENSPLVKKLKKASRLKTTKQSDKKSGRKNQLDEETLRALKAGGYIR